MWELGKKYLVRAGKSEVKEFDSGATSFLVDFCSVDNGKDRLHDQVNLIKRNGELNKFGFLTLRRAFHWNGRDWRELWKKDWGEMRFVITVGINRDTGALKALYIDPPDVGRAPSQPPPATPVETTPESMAAKYGDQVLELFPVEDVLESEEVQTARRVTFEALRATLPADAGEEDISGKWFELLDKFFPNTDGYGLTVGDWQRVQAAVQPQTSPSSTAPAVPDANPQGVPASPS